MAQATLDRVLEEIRTLTPDELRRVRQLIDARLQTPDRAPGHDPAHALERFYQALRETGTVKTLLPPPEHYEDPPLVHIQGKPLSETIIEERR